MSWKLSGFAHLCKKKGVAGWDEGDLGDKNGNAGKEERKKRRVAVRVRHSLCLDSVSFPYSNTHTY